MKPLVVHIIDRLPPDGAERLLCEVLRYRSDRFDYEVLCLVDGGELLRPIQELGVPVTVLGKRRGIDPVMFWRLCGRIRRRRPAVVHTHLFTADTWGRLAAWLSGVPVIVSTVHSMNVWQGPVHRVVDRVLAGITTRIVACTPQVERKLVFEDGIAARRVITLPNGVDLRRFDDVTPLDLRREFGFGLDAPVAAVVGRLEGVKGQAGLLRVLARMKERGTDLNLLLAGTGPQRGYLEAETARLGLGDRVRFAGFRRDIPALLAAVDLLVMPSRWEGLPMALLEAMALGRPVAAYAVGGIPDVVRSQMEGLLVEPGNSSGMEQALYRLVESASLRARLGAAGRERVRMCFSAERLSADYEHLYGQGLAPTPDRQGA